MTRRGSIAYYLAGVVCGSFFFSASYYAYFVIAKGASSRNWGRDFLFVYFLTALFGFLPQLLGAWLLRRIATRFAWTTMLSWLLGGSAVFVVIVWGVGQLGLLVERWQLPLSVKASLMSALFGPMFVALQPLWVPIPAAAATAWVLFTVHRAFAERQ